MQKQGVKVRFTVILQAFCSKFAPKTAFPQKNKKYSGSQYFAA
jgi:hypothetical protein